MGKILFKEQQGFTQSWLWFLLILSLWIPLFIVGYLMVTSLKNKMDEAMMFMFVFLFVLVVSGGLTWLIKKLRLIVEARNDGLWFKFPPLLYKWEYISRSEITKFELRTYKPIWEFGGWGIKGSSKNKAYNISGNIGLQLYLKNGKKI